MPQHTTADPDELVEMPTITTPPVAGAVNDDAMEAEPDSGGRDARPDEGIEDASGSTGQETDNSDDG